VHEERKRYDAAFAAFDRAWTLQPTLPLVEGRRLHVKMHLCDWSGLDQEIAALHARVRQGAPASPPFTLLATSSAPAEQFACARSFTALQYPPPAQPAVPPPAGRRDKIRLGYVSGEFREQATSYLTADLYESHDRNRFELIAISTGRTEGSPMRRRLEAAFDAFEQVEGQSAAAIAETIRRHEVDVLIDLNGYFGVERTDVFRLRPAPVQVNFLGFPGTMGADFIDYIVADRVVLPPEHAPFYSEQIAWLPDCYQCNDRKRPIAETPKSRALAGLPESGFVFCCFDNPDKLTPAMFDVWMRILSRVEGSVLWLLDANPFVRGTLMREAERRGVAAGRLRFAPVRPLPEHLARLRLADLVLDTLPHNAHTTASDALWAGVPVLTALGTTFAGRVAASLLSASGLPELITSGWDEYENAAVALATDPARLAGLRAALARNRDSCRLFDTPRFARHLESAYITMVSRARRGDRPASFAVEAIA
jgi:predicted O-linked N-acetylglucosamine transferase (SPINDLY family)